MVETRSKGKRREVVIEPDEVEHLLVSSWALFSRRSCGIIAPRSVLLTSVSVHQASKVARRTLPDAKRAPVSPVFLVARGLSDDRDLFFQNCSSRD